MKRMLKRALSLILITVIMMTLCSCKKTASTDASVPAGTDAPDRVPAGGVQVKRYGILSMLNMSEEDYSAFQLARQMSEGQLAKEGYAGIPVPGGAPEGAPAVTPPDMMEAPLGSEKVKPQIIYYDTLDAMLMALKAGDVGSIEIYQSVARYLCANNDNLKISVTYDLGKELNTFAELMFKGHGGNDFSFLLLEKNTALRDEFNAAIESMKEDGTLEKLVSDQIDRLIDGGEFISVEMPSIEGADTIRVAVTGALPPMDYVAADGTPAGFNTAVLSEISRRIGKNIELVVVDSIGRATALASGVVDAAFWTRTNTVSSMLSGMTEAVKAAELAGIRSKLSEDELKIMESIDAIINMEKYGSGDMPEGTIVTDSYYSDVFVPVELK